jgi:hypothetical protein
VTTSAIQEAIERQPFHPFSVRLNNGAVYRFDEARAVGATRDYRELIYFAKPGGCVTIDTESIAEIIRD